MVYAMVVVPLMCAARNGLAHGGTVADAVERGCLRRDRGIRPCEIGHIMHCSGRFGRQNRAKMQRRFRLAGLASIRDFVLGEQPETSGCGQFKPSRGFKTYAITG